MRRFRILAPIVLLFACTSGEAVGPETVAHVQLVPALVTLTSAGATQQFTAQVTNESGDPVSGASLTWRSSNPAVLTVNSTGLATAVAEGEAAVIAQAGSASGQADVSVDIPQCVQPRTVQLVAGGVLVTDPPTAPKCALTLPTGAVGDRYRVAIVRVLPNQESTLVDAALTATPQGNVTNAPVPELRLPDAEPTLGARDLANLRQAASIADATERVHARLRAGEDALLRRLGPLHPEGIVLPPARPQSVSPPKRTFLPRLPSDIQCTPAPSPATGVLIAQSADVAIYQDSTQAADPKQTVSVVYAQRMIDFFAAYGKPTIEPYFGAIPDKDGNSQVVVFATPQVGGSVAAFVWGGDQLPKSDCPASNEMELVYFNAALINAIGNNQFQALETLVHEVKHVVSFHERVVGRNFTTQPVWIEEGTAEIAGEVASRKAWAVAGGPAVTAMVNARSFTNTGPQLTAENFGIYLRLLRTVQYLGAQPNSLTFATSAAYSIYGSGWHFHRFLGDAYGSAATGQEAALFHQQNKASTPAGIPGLKAITGKSFAELMADFAAAIMLNGTGAPQPARAFTGYDFPSATTLAQIQPKPQAPYPYAVTTGSFATRRWTGQIGTSGIVIHEFTSNGTGVGTDLTVQVEAPARVVVVRLR